MKVVIFMFDTDGLIIEILGVFRIRRDKSDYRTNARPFSVLSKRINGQSRFFTGEKALTVGVDDILFIPAGTNYRQLGTKEEVVTIHFNILNASFCKIKKANCERKRTDAFFDAILSEWETKNGAYKYRCTAMFNSFLAELCNSATTDQNPIISNSLTYISAHFKEPLRIGKLAEMCHISENYYRRLFHEQTGNSPKSYINKLKISAAESYIKSGYYSMGEISDMCGFSDQKQFCTVFKSVTGHTPSEYEKYIAQNDICN